MSSLLSVLCRLQDWVDYSLAYQRFGLLEGKFCTMDFSDEVDGDYFGF